MRSLPLNSLHQARLFVDVYIAGTDVSVKPDVTY